MSLKFNLFTWILHLILIILMKFVSKFDLYKHAFHFSRLELSFRRALPTVVISLTRNCLSYHHTMLRWKYRCLAVRWNYLRCCQLWLCASDHGQEEIDLWPRMVHSDLYAVYKVYTWYYCSHQFNQQLDRHTLGEQQWKWRSHNAWP